MALLSRCTRAVALATCGGVLAACERVVPLVAEAVDPLLVVEARVDITVSGRPSTSFVRLARTMRLDAAGAPEPVTGASVQVTDDAGRVVAFQELTGRRGTYVPRTPLPPSPMYRLQVAWAGDRYEAVEPLPRARPIDSVRFGTGPIGVPGDRTLLVDFTDLAPGSDFYQWELYNDGRPALAPDSLFLDVQVLSDSSFNGRKVRGYSPYPYVPFAAGSEARVRQATVSPAAGAYLASLDRQRGIDDSPFARPPFNVRGNIVNLTTPSRRAIGALVVRHVHEVTTRVP